MLLAMDHPIQTQARHRIKNVDDRIANGGNGNKLLHIVPKRRGGFAPEEISQAPDAAIRRTRGAWVVSFRQGCVRRAESGFLLGEEAADRGSTDFEFACDLGFTAALLVQLSSLDCFVNYRWWATEAFALLPGVS